MNPKKLEVRLDNPNNKPKAKINCPHKEYCSVKRFGRINCLFDYKSCQTYKFYEKYSNHQNMFVGSKI